MAIKIARSRKKQKKYIIFAIIASVILIALIGTSSAIIKKIKTKYEEQIEDYKMREYLNKRIVYWPKSDIKYNTVLEESMFDITEIFSSVPQDLYMSSDDIGKMCIIDISAGAPVMKCMLENEQIPDDIREEEFNMFLLQSNLQKNDFVDIRICFPNGEDYIVASKKKIQNIELKTNTILTWLNEKEILTVNCAIVDAYLNKGTKLYIVKYVQPITQKEAIPTYPVNTDVLKVMKDNPNIIDKAGNELAAQIRLELEERLRAISPESLSNVNAGLNQDSSKRADNFNQQNEGLSEMQTGQQKETSPENTIKDETNINDGGSDDNGFFN